MTNFLTYESPNFGYKIQYPSDWVKDDEDRNEIVNLRSFCPLTESNQSAPYKCMYSPIVVYVSVMDSKGKISKRNY